MAYQKIQLFGGGLKAISPTITAQRRVNCYYDYRIDAENNDLVIIQTPGLTRFVTLPQQPIRGMWQNGQYAFVVAGTGLYLITNNGFTFLGDFGPAGATRPVKMTNDTNTLAIVDGVNVYTMSLTNLDAAINAPGSIITGLSVIGQIVGAV